MRARTARWTPTLPLGRSARRFDPPPCHRARTDRRVTMAGTTAGVTDVDSEYRICRGDSPAQVLAAVTLCLRLNSEYWWVRGQMDSPAGYWRDEQRSFVYRAGRGRLLVTGDHELARGLRRLLADGAAPAWDQVPLPKSPRPLSDLLDKLNPSRYGQAGLRERCATLLRQSGFVFAEEVAVLPEECLSDIRRAGPKFVAAILDAAAALNVPRPLPLELEAVLDRLDLPHLRAAAPRILASARARPRDPADLLIELLAAEESGRAQARA